MTDEYICKDCGHRAGDHAVNNRCLNCDCVADPYLEQLVDLREQLVELQTDKVELIAQRDTWIGNADALRKRGDELHLVYETDVTTLQSHIQSLQAKLDIAADKITVTLTHLREFDNVSHYHYCIDLAKITLDNALAEIEKVGKDE